MAACGKANDGIGTEPEGKEKGRVGEEDVGNRHDRIGGDTIRAWDGWSKRGHGTNRGETQEEPSTPIREASVVTDQRKTEETVGGGEELESDEESGTRVDVRCGKVGEQAQDDEPESGGATTMEDEETDAEFGCADEGRNMEHALRPTGSQGTSMHPVERQRETDDNGRAKPFRGRDKMKDSAVRRRDRRHGPSAIGGESCLRKRRRCVETKGRGTREPNRAKSEFLRAKRASEVAEDSEVGSTDADVGEATYLYGRVRGAGRKTGRAMWPRKGQMMRTGMIGKRERPMEGKHPANRVSTPRYVARGRPNPACDRKGRGSVWLANEEGKGRKTGSTTAFGRAEQDGRNGHRIWHIGWRQRFGRNRWAWWIGWSPCFESMRRVWRTGRRRWSVWNGCFCSKWRTKAGVPTRQRRSRLPVEYGRLLAMFTLAIVGWLHL
jgi:hypothetical protein